MTTPIDRFKQALENVFTAKPAPDQPSWGDRFRNWMVSWATKGITDALEDITPEQKAALDAVSKRIIDDPDIPADFKDLMEAAGMKGNPLLTFVKYVIYGYWLIDLISRMIAPEGTKLGYIRQREFEPYRFDPISVITAWRRDKPTYEKYFADLRDLGWSTERIEALKFLTEIIPNVSDLVRMAVREAFTPEIAEKFGQYQDYPDAITEWGEKQGLSKEWLTRYWAAHWDLPAPTQGFEMLHRGVINEEELKLLLRALDVMPYWRDKLTDIAWELPTRVDIRRFWDMRTIDEARLRELYAARGYHGKDLDDYVLWTKIYTDFPDLLARYKNGWITLDQVKREIIGMGLSPERADTLIEEKIKKAAPERVATEKDLTKADIVTGVKKGVITRGEGTVLLMEIGYDPDEADYILAVSMPLDETDVVVKQRELTKADIIAGLKAGVITEPEALTKLIDLRYTTLDAQFLLMIFVAQVSVANIESKRELAKGDVTSALKRSLISPAVATEMLIALRYTVTDATFLVNTNLPPPAKVVEEKERLISTVDIMKALQVGQITVAETENRLTTLGYSVEDATFLVTLHQTINTLKLTLKPKEESKADILLAVKKGLITPEDGYLMLQNIGFTPEASQFILMVQAESSPFSPMSYQEFKDVTGKYRKAAGVEATPEVEELRKAGAEVVKLSKDLDILKASLTAEDRKLISAEVLPPEATKRRDELRVTLHRAEATMAAAKSHYDALIAEWRHKA